MRIGLDIGEKEISAVLLNDGKIIDRRSESIYSLKRDVKKVIMDKTLNLVHGLITPAVKYLGISLPSTYDPNRGTVYDLHKIPYWKKIKIRQILEDEFNIPVLISSDINCFLLEEKFHGINKGFKNCLCIILDKEVKIGLMVNDKLYSDQQPSFRHIKCLSEASCEYVRVYKQSYRRTVDEIEQIYADFTEEYMCMSHHILWKELGNSIGRLVSILLMNCSFNNILLGGGLSRCLINLTESMSHYWETILPPSIIKNMIITVSQAENPKPLGACYIAS